MISFNRAYTYAYVVINLESKPTGGFIWRILLIEVIEHVAVVGQSTANRFTFWMFEITKLGAPK